MVPSLKRKGQLNPGDLKLFMDTDDGLHQVFLICFYPSVRTKGPVQPPLTTGTRVALFTVTVSDLGLLTAFQ